MPRPLTRVTLRPRILAAVLFVALTCLSVGGASAGPLVVGSTAPGEVFAALLIDDASGNALFPYVHLASGLTLSEVTIDDSGPIGSAFVANAEDLLPGSFPAVFLFATPDLLQLSVLFFDFANSSFSGLEWTVPGYAVPIGLVTDPAMVALESGFTSKFLFHSFVPIGEGQTIALYDLQPAPVPEPAMLSLLGIGVAGSIARIRRRRLTAAK